MLKWKATFLGQILFTVVVFNPAPTETLEKRSMCKYKTSIFSNRKFVKFIENDTLLTLHKNNDIDWIHFKKHVPN